MKTLKYAISNENLSLFPDFQQRLNVLRTLGFIERSDNSTNAMINSTSSITDIVTLKGRVACEMNTCDELMATEIIFNNILEPLNPAEVVAMLSSLIFQVYSEWISVYKNVIIMYLNIGKSSYR